MMEQLVLIIFLIFHLDATTTLEVGGVKEVSLLVGCEKTAAEVLASAQEKNPGVQIEVKASKCLPKKEWAKLTARPA